VQLNFMVTGAERVLKIDNTVVMMAEGGGAG
jgi:hypothetical protein